MTDRFKYDEDNDHRVGTGSRYPEVGSLETPQVETVDVPPNPEILLGWARRLFETAPLDHGVADAAGWNHQRVLWERSYEMYRTLPQPTYDDLPKEFDKMWQEIADTPASEATLTLLSDTGPILGCPEGTRPDRAEHAKEVLAEWWTKPDAPLVLLWPVDVRDLRG